MKAVLLNGSLEKGCEETTTEQLLHYVAHYLKKETIDIERIHVRDFHIQYGIKSEIDTGDDWPFIFEKILEADLIFFATPVAMGDKSSLITLILERLQGYYEMKNKKGQGIFYNKVAGVIVAGGDHGAYHAASTTLYRLSMLGFTLPPHASAICEDQVKNKEDWACVENEMKTMTYNIIHFAELLNFNPIPIIEHEYKE